MEINLHDYDLVVLNNSGGKDSICSIWEICRLAKKQNYSKDKIIVSHQEVRNAEWDGTKELVIEQSEMFGLKLFFSLRIDKNGKNETLLEYVERRGKWPSNKQRYCTSDFKRAPGAKVVTAQTKSLGKCKILHVFGFRAEESPARSKKEVLAINKNLTTKKRLVHDFLPIHDWNLKKVWRVIKLFKLPYHYAYDLGMPRLSCVFCIFSPFDALVIAGRENKELLNDYIRVQDKIGHLFRDKFDLKTVKTAIENNYQPENIADWTM